MKVSVLFAAMAAACGPAFAQSGATMVDGDWIGKGSFQIGPSIVGCTEIKMKFVGTATLYGVRDGAVVCESIKQAFPMNDDFSVGADNDIYYKDRKVGAVTDNKLVVLVPGKDEIGTEFTLRREGELIYYNEVARAPGKPPVFGMVAILQKDPNAGSPRQ